MISDNEGCMLCPRRCGVDRRSGTGFCGAPQGLEVSAICLHRGEEPPLSPIVNVFFAHCNLHCVYCQNHEVSARGVDGRFVHWRTVDEVADECCRLLPQADGRLGFVTAAHYLPYVAPIVEAVRRRGIDPTVVYNSSGYEEAEALRTLEGWVDIYLPDFKYMDPALAARWSHAADYPQVAQRAIAEMRRQVGAGLKVDGDHAYRGLVVRHLVLPGEVDNSLRCLEWLADEFPFGLHLSLMAQYYPPMPSLPAPLNRTLTAGEYAAVVDRAVELGLTDGWIQQLEAERSYRPDFSLPDPFNRTPNNETL